MRPLLLAVCIVAAGCASEPATEPALTESSGQAETFPDSPVLALSSDAGSVRLGGSLDQAKAAFPAPQGAEVSDEPRLLEVVSLQGWSWGAGAGTGFEAATTDGRIVALARAELDGPKEVAVLDQAVAEFGDPAHRAESENVAMLSWEAGDYARVLVLFKRDVPRYGSGSITLIGRKEELAQVSYVYDRPQEFVDRIDDFVEALSRTGG